MNNSINYFGTDLSRPGHYFWTLKGDDIYQNRIHQDSLPFIPDYIINSSSIKGLTLYARVANYSILAIAGSCTDSRIGTKSVFWVEQPMSPQELKELILSIPIGKKIINQMSFEVKW